MFYLFRKTFLRSRSDRTLNFSLNFKTSNLMKSRNEAEEEVSIVDEEDNVIGKAIRKTMRENRWIHRATYIFILTSDNRFHVHKRTMMKKWCPGYWDVVSGGVVEYGESYEENAERELGEEFGLKVPLKPLFKFYFENPETRIWGKAFLGRNDGPLKLQEDEIELVEFMSKEEIDERMKKGEKFTPDSNKAYQMFLQNNCFSL